MDTNDGFVLEPGQRFLERAMTSLPLCFSTVTFRTRAIREAGRMIVGEELFADVPLVMRVALRWDVAYIDRPLVAFRLHDQTQTRRLSTRESSHTETTDRLLAYGQALFDRRMRFLAEAELPTKTIDRYRARATLRFLADRAGLGLPWLRTWRDFAGIVRLHPPILTHPIAWRLVTAQLGGRTLRRVAYRVASAVTGFRNAPVSSTPERRA